MTAERPWWTRKSGIAALFVAGSIAGFLVSVAAPLVSNQKLADQQAKLQRQIARDQQTTQRKLADVSAKLENQNRKVEVSRLLFEHYFGKPANEQRAVISYLTYQFPGDMSRKSVQAILVVTARKKTEVRREVTKSVASIKRVAVSNLQRAVAAERAGLRAVIAGDLATAAKEFGSAYDAYPTYHNVDEISRKVLAPAVSGWRSGSPELREQLVRRTAGTIVSEYAWGIPEDLKPRLEKLAGH
jgi:hypothetical protein